MTTLSIIWFLCLLCSVASSFGIAIALVKKGDEWPIQFYTNILRKYILPLVHRNMPSVLDCVICTSFWTTLITDLLIHFIFCSTYFAWPISGFITVGISWVLMDALDSLNLIGSSIQESVKKDEK